MSSLETRLYEVRVVRLQHRQRPDAPTEDLWRLLGATAVPYSKQALWSANDLRLGEGARLAADRLNELFAEAPDRSANISVLVVREDMDFVITVGGARESLDVLWTDASGRLMGRRFDRALAQFRVVCRRDPARPDAVCVAMVPEVLFGAEELHWVRTPTGHVQRMSRGSFVLTDLAAEASLTTGRLLVIGGTPSSALSLGGAMFFEHRGPDTWTQTVIISVTQARPEEVPRDQPATLLPKARPSPAPPDPKAPPKAPAKSGG